MAGSSSHDSVSLLAHESQGCLGKRTDEAGLGPWGVWAQSRDRLSRLVTLPPPGMSIASPKFGGRGCSLPAADVDSGLTKERDGRVSTEN